MTKNTVKWMRESDSQIIIRSPTLHFSFVQRASIETSQRVQNKNKPK